MLCQVDSVLKGHAWVLCSLVLLVFVLAGCSGGLESGSQVEPKTKDLLHKSGYSILVFDSAKEQLNYALSRFSDLKERKVALEAVGVLFPRARIERAEAELELAYLSLGEDFRLASRSRCLQAIVKYETILKDFEDLPPVCAKARWYIAWIYMDLLHDKDKGIENYKRVVSDYPHEGFLPSPRLHWQEIFAQQASRETTFLSAREQWAAVALLELARNQDDPGEKIRAVEQLMTYYPTSRAVVYGLMSLLETQPVSQRSIQMAKEYLASDNAYLPLAVYLRKRMEALGSKLLRRRSR